MEVIVTTDKTSFSGRDTKTGQIVVIREGEKVKVSDDYGAYIIYEYAPNITQLNTSKKAKI